MQRKNNYQAFPLVQKIVSLLASSGVALLVASWSSDWLGPSQFELTATPRYVLP